MLSGPLEILIEDWLLRQIFGETLQADVKELLVLLEPLAVAEVSVHQQAPDWTMSTTKEHLQGLELECMNLAPDTDHVLTVLF